MAKEKDRIAARADSWRISGYDIPKSVSKARRQDSSTAALLEFVLGEYSHQSKIKVKDLYDEGQLLSCDKRILNIKENGEIADNLGFKDGNLDISTDEQLTTFVQKAVEIGAKRILDNFGARLEELQNGLYYKTGYKQVAIFDINLFFDEKRQSLERLQRYAKELDVNMDRTLEATKQKIDNLQREVFATFGNPDPNKRKLDFEELGLGSKVQSRGR